MHCIVYIMGTTPLCMVFIKSQYKIYKKLYNTSGVISGADAKLFIARNIIL